MVPQIERAEKKQLRLFEKLIRSEQEKSVLLDAMTKLVLYLDTDLRVIWANKAMHDAFGMTTGPHNRKHCDKALHDSNKVCSVCPAQKTLKPGKPHEVVDLLSDKRNWVLRSYPVHDEKGALTGIMEIVTAITERRRAEEALRQSEQQYRELFENASDIILILDFDGETAMFSEKPHITINQSQLRRERYDA
ncbi:MAG: hypothetical protein QG555_658 [Thermodesulfobacteriota bacterium]|nr:hypothetical protein [Thermodesulfobacteriota bacterium]